MQQPGLSRAVPMGVLGFLVGALLVIGVRALQSLDPIWDVGTGIVFATFFCAGFFVWGIGAFDPRLSVHGEEAEAAHALAETTAEPPPTSIFTSTLWQTVFLVVILIVALGAFAKLGPGITITTDNASSVLAVGMVPAQIAGHDVEISTLVIFVAFVIFMLVSLVAAAWLIYVLMSRLVHGVAEARTVAAGGTVALPAPRSPPRDGRLGLLIVLARAVVVFVVLYAFFYYVAIGLILPKPELQLELLSFVNALLFTVIIVRPSILIRLIAIVSAYVANLLRGGNLRGGKKPDGTQKIKRTE